MTTTQKTRKKRKRKVYKPITIESWGNGFNIEISRKLSNDMKSMQHLAHQLIDLLVERRRRECLSDLLEVMIGVCSGAIAEEFITKMISNTRHQQESDNKLKAAKRKRKTSKSDKSKRAKGVT